MAGYYEYRQRQRVVLTEEKIKQFEEDIKKGKNIDVEDYVQEHETFEHVSKRLGSKISEVISKYTRKGIETTFKMLNNFIES
jgi:23S rRNA G2445 N2-methylase RlmL